MFVEYAEFSKTYRFYIIEPNDSILVHAIIESRDAILMKIVFHQLLDLKFFFIVILKRLIYNEVLKMIK